ncbi:hypothetical protein [Halospeciosus flavus]|uniref:Uncharacterized protein n=1 Tax=Halospeciosus flavus TaxID=3032283 RepID=A0ABD5Z7E6_9EURY|nr:hypothetical protein [Halospeciosus flavus]
MSDNGGTDESDGPATDDGASLEALRNARSEARETLSEQSQMFRRTDKKAIRLLKFNATLLVVLATLLPAVANANLGVTVLFSGYLAVGFVCLLASAAMAGVAYTTTAQYSGIGPTDLSKTVIENYHSKRFEKRLVSGYAKWIRGNRRTNTRKAPLITATLLLMLGAMGGFLLAFFATFNGSVPRFLLAAVVVVLVGATYFSRLHEQIARWRRAAKKAGQVDDGDFDAVDVVDPFHGEQLSTGREEGTGNE